jgi:hypothetical protein
MYHFPEVWLRIDRNFVRVIRNNLRLYTPLHNQHEITSIRLYTLCNPQGCVQSDWGYFEWTEQIISINPYKNYFCYDIIIEKYIYFFQNKANNRK